MRYLSLCSGIEAASVAWMPLGWTPVAFAEHEPESSDGGFAAALLAHRFPDVPNLGPLERVTRKKLERLGHIDVIIGGTPCQDLSVAGKRAGLAGARSSLFHHYARIVHAARRVCGTRWALWENVPGAFSSNQGADFALVVGALAGCELAAPVDGWRSEGVALGDDGLVEWAVLDTQWFGLAQRRDRVFVVVDFGDWTGRAPILLEPESLRGDSAPRREAGARVAGTLGARSLDGSGTCGGDGRESFLVANGDVAGALTSHHVRGVPEAEANQLVPEVAATMAANKGRLQLEQTYIPEVADPVTRQEGRTYTHEGAGNFRTRNVVACFDETQITHPENRSTAAPDTAHVAASARPPTIAFDWQMGGHPTNSMNAHVEVSQPLIANRVPAVAFSLRGRDGGNMPELEPDDVSPAIRGPGGGSSLPFVFKPSYYTRDKDGAPADVVPPLSHDADKGDQEPLVYDVAVRRLTPRECERLFGFPDDWTLVPYRGKPAKDTPRYAALGNSIGIEPLAWIGRRIAAA